MVSNEAAQQALETIAQKLKEDSSFLKEWHATLACAAIEEGVRHSTGRAIATRFMKEVFDIEDEGEL